MTTNAKVVTAIVWILIFLGVFLRAFRADKFPINNNDDGLFYVWTGNSVLSNPAQPVSHTIFNTENPSLIWWSQYMDYIPVDRFGMKIIRPWFDHPPLASLFIALPARMLGYTDIEQLPHMLVRFPALLASIATLLFTFLVARKWFGTSVALLALLFLATTPYFVFAHRQAYLENFITPTFLASLWFLSRFTEKNKRQDLWLCVLLAAATGWMKIPAFSFPFMVVGWLLYIGKKKEAFTTLAAALLSPLLYVGYGFAIDSAAFLRTLNYQGVRGAFPSSLLMNLVKPEFYQPFLDGWYVFGLVCALALTLSVGVGTKDEKLKSYAWFFSAWLFALFLVSGKMNNSPWYKYPLIPFISMAMGYYAEKYLKNGLLFLAAPLFMFGFTGLDLLNVEVQSSIVRLMTVVVAGLSALPFLFPKFKLAQLSSKGIAIAMITGIVVLNSYISIQYPFIYCKEGACQQSEKILLK